MRGLLPALCALALAWAAAETAPAAAGEARYDVVVVGSEPEAIAAAVAAAEEGAKTLLLSGDPRLGGLFVLGELNVLDLRTKPVNLQQGLFARWWGLVGGGHAFDVGRAESAFAALLAAAGVEVRLDEEGLEPLLEDGRVIGVAAGQRRFLAAQTIDGTADMDLAALAGAPSTVGFASLGLDERMVDTLVFRIDGVDWPALQQGIRERGRGYASVDDLVAWGHFGGHPASYRPLEPGLRLRGLNLGLQDDGSVLVNALLIHGVDPFDESSVAAARERAAREAPRVVEFLRELPGFARARYAGAAERLYVRESRHLRARCTLSANDVLDNRVTGLDVAAGGYPLDVQALTPNDSGYVFGTPEVYGARLCMTVPLAPAGLWVVGRAAGFDPIAASSARVVPFGMALAEAVGVAAARAAQRGLEPAELAADPDEVRWVRAVLARRGAYLPPLVEREPAGPHQHPHFEAFRLMLGRGLAVGGYANDPGLDQGVSALSHLYLLSNVLQRFYFDGSGGQALVAQFGQPEGPLTPLLAARLTEAAACRAMGCDGAGELLPKWLLELPADRQLTRGQSYELAAGLARRAPPGPDR